MPVSPKVYTWLCGLFAALGSVTFGYDLGIIATVESSDDFLLKTGNPTETQLGLITGCLCWLARNIYVGSFADTFGRRLTILAGCIVFLIGGAIQTAAQNIGYMYGGRFLAGMGIGMLAMLAPLYQAEIAHPSIRGRLTTLQQFMLGIGSLIASFIGYGCYHGLTGQAQWRVPLEALLVLGRLHAHGDITDPFVVSEHLEILEQLFGIPSNFRRLVLGVASSSASMTGVSCIQYYAPTIYASIGIDTSTTLGLQSGNSVLCIWYIDRLGRRKVFVWGNALCGLTFVVGTIIIARFPAGSNNPNASRAFVAMTWLFNLVFSACCGPLSWARNRAKATAITSSAAWISNFMIAQVSPPAFTTVGWKFYLTFAICGFTNALFFWAFLPETRGIPLEELDSYFESVPVFVPGSHVALKDPNEREAELYEGKVHVAGAPVQEKMDNEEIEKV
ncbi:general substrate transporter [Fomitopsis serialis]|uniref:general substrate transporter n=1 Tax=Fomitopsis serialis TaxID=139415 RepID=UPI002007727A|nr:general substrate transporter [Neoantrodia serialis]KAH9922482.1 general substrate transporter [Neoantrodia serialis]